MRGDLGRVGDGAVGVPEPPAQLDGTELRAFAGNFLYSTGANETAGRHTLVHFDVPMRNCTITLDGIPVVESGRLAF